MVRGLGRDDSPLHPQSVHAEYLHSRLVMGEGVPKEE